MVGPAKNPTDNGGAESRQTPKILFLVCSKHVQSVQKQTKERAWRETVLMRNQCQGACSGRAGPPRWRKQDHDLPKVVVFGLDLPNASSPCCHREAAHNCAEVCKQHTSTNPGSVIIMKHLLRCKPVSISQYRSVPQYLSYHDLLSDYVAFLFVCCLRSTASPGPLPPRGRGPHRGHACLELRPSAVFSKHGLP